MNALSRNALVATLLMCATAVLALVMKPVVDAQAARKIDLVRAIPERFADWIIDPRVHPVEPPPELKKVIEATYDQTLTRTYTNSVGWQVMLSLAYSGTSSKDNQTHRPEICYPAQGFQLKVSPERQSFMSNFGPISVTRLIASGRGVASEPITYWYVMGGEQADFDWSWRLRQIKHSLTGHMPEGLLIRVSSRGPNAQQEYAQQETFLRAMLAEISPRDLPYFVGDASRRIVQ